MENEELDKQDQQDQQDQQDLPPRESYNPRPVWQVAAAWVGLAVMILSLILYFRYIYNGGLL